LTFFLYSLVYRRKYTLLKMYFEHAEFSSLHNFSHTVLPALGIEFSSVVCSRISSPGLADIALY
jgi:hypothetical protein